jgi:hypothetical protein
MPRSCIPCAASSPRPAPISEALREPFAEGVAHLGKDHLHGFVVIGQVALWVVVGTALVSGYDYYRRFNHLPGGVLSESPR